MHPALAAFPSEKFYGSKLLSRPTDEDRPRMPGFDWPSDCLPLAFVDVRIGKGGEGGEGARVTWNERLSGDGRSISNPTEAGLVVQIVERLLKSGVDAADIAVMSPYSAQVSRFRV
jgi:superfamily I DNA and/or RNA helicase